MTFVDFIDRVAHTLDIFHTFEAQTSRTAIDTGESERQDVIRMTEGLTLAGLTGNNHGTAERSDYVSGQNSRGLH
jgi:hypothetical protein